MAEPDSTTTPASATEPTPTTKPDSSSASPTKFGAFDRYFHISERGSTFATEIRAGVVTFFAMAYIVVLNPLILGTGADVNGDVLGGSRVAAATAFAAGVMTILFGVIAKYPFGIATGLGINTLVAVTFVATEGLTWPEAMGLVVIDGIIIVLLAISGSTNAVVHLTAIARRAGPCTWGRQPWRRTARPSPVRPRWPRPPTPPPPSSSPQGAQGPGPRSPRGSSGSSTR